MRHVKSWTPTSGPTCITIFSVWTSFVDFRESRQRESRIGLSKCRKVFSKSSHDFFPVITVLYSEFSEKLPDFIHTILRGSQPNVQLSQ